MSTEFGRTSTKFATESMRRCSREVLRVATSVAGMWPRMMSRCFADGSAPCADALRRRKLPSIIRRMAHSSLSGGKGAGSAQCNSVLQPGDAGAGARKGHGALPGEGVAFNAAVLAPTPNTFVFGVSSPSHHGSEV